MSLLPFLPSGGIAYPGFSNLTGKNLQIFSPHDSVTPILDLDDEDFEDLVELNGQKFGIAVQNLTVGYDEGSSLTLVTSEDWSNPAILPGCTVLFRATINKIHDITTQPSWVQNAGTTGQALLFSGKVDDVSLSGDPESGSGASYSCKGWMFWASLVSVHLKFPSGFKLPERLYNYDSTDDSAEYKRSIKKAATFITGKSAYNYAPFGYTGIAPPNASYGTGAPINSTDNKKMKVGEILKDLFASHGESLKREGCVPDSWVPYDGTGTLPWVQAELDGLDAIPDKIVLVGTNFLDAVKQILRKSYPNYSVMVDRSKVWHFTPILDNLKTTAQSPSDILAPDKWLATRLGVITLKLAEPVGGGDTRVFGKLIKGNLSHKISDRYTAVRIVGHEKVVTSEASTLNATLKPAWGQGNASQQTNLQSGYMQGGLESSVNRHWDRGDNNLGIPLYKCEVVSGTICKLTFKGFNSELWPHTNDEWNGNTVLLGNSLNEIQSGNWIWVQSSGRYTVLDCYNVANVGDGNPGFALEVEGRGQLIPLAVQTEHSSGNEQGARIQLTDDFGLETTVAPNQLSVTHRMFKIEETTTTIGDSLNSDPSTPCNIRGIVALGGRPNQPSGGIPGQPGPSTLEEFGQSLGGTAMSAFGRLQSKAGNGGEFWFGGSLIIPFSALRRAQQKHTGGAGVPNFCQRGGALPSNEVKVVYEKSTQTFRETRVPALAPSGEETFAGTAFLTAGVRRELLIRAERWIDDSQQAEFDKFAAMILRTVSDLEPSGDGWEWIETSKYLSLIDLHFRLMIDWYHSWGGPVGGGGGQIVGIQQAVVTRISYDFESDSCTMSLDSRYNPLGSYGYDNLQEAFISAKRIKEIEEARAKAERTRQCYDALHSLHPASDYPVHPLCQDQVVRSSGPGKGKPSPPLSCHGTDDGVNASMGAEGAAAAGSSGGYAGSQYASTFSLSSGIGWYLEPFFDTQGNLFFYDRFGGVQAGDASALVAGVSTHPNIAVGSGNSNWKNDPLRKSHEMASLALALLNNILGADPAEPAQTKYNTVSDYNSGTGVVTLTYDNMNTNAFSNGMLVISSGPTDSPLVYIASNTAGTITLKTPGGGLPSTDKIPIGSHVYVMAQRKPLPGGSYAAGTRMFKNGSTWYGVQPDGTIKSATITGSTNFVPGATPAATITTALPSVPTLLGIPGSGSSGSELMYKDGKMVSTPVLRDNANNVRDWITGARLPVSYVDTATYDATAEALRILCPAGVDTLVVREILSVPAWYAPSGGPLDAIFVLPYYSDGNDTTEIHFDVRWRWLDIKDDLTAISWNVPSADLAPGSSAYELDEFIIDASGASWNGQRYLQVEIIAGRSGDSNPDDISIVGFNVRSGVKYN